MTDTSFLFDPANYGDDGKLRLPDWAGALVDLEAATVAYEVDCGDKWGNIGRLELPSRYDPRRTYSWPLYEGEIARILEGQARIEDPAQAYRWTYTAAKAASGCNPTVTVR